MDGTRARHGRDETARRDRTFAADLGVAAPNWAIAETGSFTAAGHKLHVSQSAISRQILLLEEELKEPVFLRVGRRIRITPAGDSLLQLSHRVFQDVQDTIAAISDRQESLRGTLRLVGGMTVCLYVFPPLLAEIKRAHPLLDLKVTTGSAERCIAQLLQNFSGFLESPEDAAALLIHTGSKKILDGVCKILGADPTQERVQSCYKVLKEHANLSAGSNGFILEDSLRTKREGRGLLVSFGVGFSGSAGVLEYPN